MALIKCSKCGHDISDKAEKCIHCGEPIKKEEQKEVIQEKITKEIEEGTNEIIIKENTTNVSDLENENQKLKQEINKLKTHNSNIEKKLQKQKKENINNRNNKIKETIIKLINTIRYIICCICLFAFIICLKQFNIALVYLITGILICPFIYQKIFNKVNIKTKNKILIQIFLPIIVFIALAMILGE